MAKKSRRARAKQRSLDRRIQAKPGLVTECTPTSTSPDSKVLAPSSETSPYAALSSRYQYVLSELKSIGIIAGILFVILIILAFVLR